MGKATWYVTTPIYYPSDKLHIGHAYTTVAADALARYHRLNEESVLFVTGTDEHGQKIQKGASDQGLTPLAFVDQIVRQIKDPLWKALGVSYDDFIRTTEPRHRRVVQAFFRRLREKGDIYKGTYEGWYCLPCETFWTETKVSQGNCPDCGRPVERVSQESYFFRLSAYAERIREHIIRHPEFIQPVSRRNEMLGFLDEGLEDLSISRTGMNWGIEVPDDPQHVIYVWFDALLNYLTAAGYESDEARFQATWPPNLQVMGKEIVRFHAVIWPIMLMAADLQLPEHVFGHGWLLIGDTKMSKSRGNAVDPVRLIERYGVDAIRYYLLREVPFGSDGLYTEDALVLRTNVDLANDLGNLLQRTVAMITRFCQARVSLPEAAPGERRLKQASAAAVAEVENSMASFNLSQALAAVGKLVRRANVEIEQSQPWALAKRQDRQALHTVLYDLAETLRVISVLLSPFLIEAPSRLRAQLGIALEPRSWQETEFGWHGRQFQVSSGPSLFPRIEDKAKEHDVQTSVEGRPASISPSSEETSPQEMRHEIDIDLFQQVELGVGTIQSAEIVKGADRLLKLAVDDGERVRTIVSGIRSHYAPESLIGKQVVLVKNLKPVKIRGILSEGMLLAASTGDALALVAPESTMAAGARVK